MLQGARPVQAAEIAEQVFAEIRRNWAYQDSPVDWAQRRASELLAARGIIAG
jgi:hypothetical protein